MARKKGSKSPSTKLPSKEFGTSRTSPSKRSKVNKSKSEKKKTKVKKVAKVTARKTKVKKDTPKVKASKKANVKKVASKKALTKRSSAKGSDKKTLKPSEVTGKVKRAEEKPAGKVFKKEIRKAVPLPKASKRGRKSEPKTMEELLAQTGYELRGVKRGELIEGTVTDVSKKMVLVDIGSKTEGLVVDKEFEAAREFISELSIGDKVIVYVLSPENERGQILLSLKKAATDRTWEKFEEALKTNSVVNVRGLDVNRGGVVVRADSLQGFVPSSQFGKEWLGKMEDLLENVFQVRVIEVSREKNRLIFSEKQVSEAEEIEQRTQALEQINMDEVYDGVVSGIMPFGVFVSVDVPIEKSKVKSQKSKVQSPKSKVKSQKLKVGKVEGLVHISEISWEKVDDPNKHFNVGQKVKVKVLGIEESSAKLNLSVKRLSGDPWEKIEKNYSAGKKVKGKVARVAPFGVFVMLEPGIEGLLHISKIPSGEEPKAGSNIEVFVEQVDPENRRMSLGMVLTEVPVGYK